MLAITTYPQEYVDQVRSRFAADVAAYNAGSPAAAFEPVFFNNLVIALDHHFCHRVRNREGKDGNALNEVRVIVNSLMENDGLVKPDSAVKLKPETSVLGYAPGDRIALSADDFERISDGFLREIEARYS